ncbi:hypothetical protein [Methylopila sp. M107]|uniref:hypothetical protein n=1 Tax=Methylopila sp. M107 TaxID=1101190 RepID=UPI00037A19D1|nr:hypothetical protein [Methylopila sp. M107]
MRKWLSKVLREAKPAEAPAPAGRFVEARDDDAGWRPVSQTKRDLAPMTQRRMQDLAHHAWEQHRVANRLIELPIAFILGDGVEVTCKDDEANEWLRQWWRDPITRMPLTLEKRVRELALFGEQVIVTFKGASGHVRHGAIDPSMINDVIVDPENASLVIGVQVRTGPATLKTYPTILDGPDDELLAPGAIALRERMTGQPCHFWRINDLLTGRRGRSDLLSAIDISDAYTQLIFGEVERAAAMRMVVWDVTMKGATPEQVEERARNIAPPTPLSVRVHNDSEVWDALSAQLNSADASETLRVVRNEVLGGGTVPEHWYGGGGDVNRATAAEMDEPTYKVFRRRQRLWEDILETEARYVIRRRLEAIGLPELANEPAYQPTAVFPEMQSVDISRYAQALAQLVVAVGALIDRGLLTEEVGLTMIASLADKFGVEIDAAAELAKALKEKTKRDARQAESDVFREPPGQDIDDDAEDRPPAADAAA